MLEILSVSLLPIPDKRHLLAYVDIQCGPLIVRKVRVKQALSGQVIVCFSENPTVRECHGCRTWVPYNHLHCHHCGRALDKFRLSRTAKGKVKRHKAVVHPADAKAREQLTRLVLHAYCDEFHRQQRPRTFVPSISA